MGIWLCSVICGWGSVCWKFHCVHDVCLKYMAREVLLCILMCFWGTGWGNIYCVKWCLCEVQCEGYFTLYINVCMTYRLRLVLLCKVMFLWGRVWGKCYCLEWCVCELQVKGNISLYINVFSGIRWGKFNVYNYVSLKNIVCDILFCIMKYLWDTVWG